MGDPMLYGPAWRIPDPEDEEDVGEYERREAISLFLTQPFDLTQYRMIDPNDRFFVRYVSLIMAAAWAVQETNNRDLNANFKIGMVGSIDDQAVPDEIRNDPERYIEFMNPVTHRTYFAVKTETYAYNLPREDAEPFISLGYDLLKSIRDRYYENGNLKQAVLDQAQEEALAEDPTLAGANLQAAVLSLAQSKVHQEFMWVDLIRSIVDTYEMR